MRGFLEMVFPQTTRKTLKTKSKIKYVVVPKLFWRQVAETKLQYFLTHSNPPPLKCPFKCRNSTTAKIKEQKLYFQEQKNR